MKIIKNKKTIENYIQELLEKDKARQNAGILIPFSYKEDVINFLKLKKYLQYELVDHFQITRNSYNSVWIRISNSNTFESNKIILCSTNRNPTD